VSRRGVRHRLCAITVVAVAVAGALGLAACGTPSAQDGGGDGPTTVDRGFNGVVRTPPLDVAAVTLPDVAPGADGAPFPLAAPADGYLVVFFGFTSCPDVCPSTLAALRTAEERVADRLGPEAAARVEVAMVTVDPQRDTVEKLNAYVGSFLPSWHALRTDDEAALAAAMAPFGATATQRPTSRPGFYTVDHTSTLFVVDDRGRVVLDLPFGATPAQIADDLTLLLEGGPPSA
jgi:protein SCO1/2